MENGSPLLHANSAGKTSFQIPIYTIRVAWITDKDTKYWTGFIFYLTGIIFIFSLFFRQAYA